MNFKQFLNEAKDPLEGFDGVLVKGLRTTKLTKKGETSLGYVLNKDDKKLEVLEYNHKGAGQRFVVKLKTEKLDTSKELAVAKVDKPSINAFDNSKFGSLHLTFKEKLTVETLLSKFASRDDRVVITEKANKYLETTKEVKDPADEEPEELFAIGYWSNPYRSNDREYFWMSNAHGDFESRKEILAAANRKCERGQPTRFRDFMSGSAKAFTSRKTFLAYAEKVGLNPNIRD